MRTLILQTTELSDTDYGAVQIISDDNAIEDFGFIVETEKDYTYLEEIEELTRKILRTSTKLLLKTQSEINEVSVVTEAREGNVIQAKKALDTLSVLFSALEAFRNNFLTAIEYDNFRRTQWPNTQEFIDSVMLCHEAELTSMNTAEILKRFDSKTLKFLDITDLSSIIESSLGTEPCSHKSVRL